ncbi:MAG: hypothetical protein J5953_03395 [Prevotella sp.]|nr:hypothetical protein [Prevotella sp.]MBO5629866.1 hypothetical protein [Aeriscardovia sp.]
MKKFFTLLAAVMMAVSMNAQSRTTLWEGSLEFGSTWPSVQIPVSSLGSYKVGDAFIITVSKADNAINTGWEWGPQVFINLDWKTLFGAKNLTNGATDFEVKFTLSEEEYEKLGAGTEVEVQGMNAVVTKVELETNEVIEYEATGTAIEMDEYKQIYKDQLASYSGNDKLVFTYKIEGVTDYEEGGETKSVIGWGIGAIRSLGGNVEVASLPVKGIGEYSVSYTIDELQAAINDTNTEYGTNGLVLQMWNCKDAIGSAVSIIAYRVAGTDINAVTSQKLQPTVIYNLAGQKVNAQYKGVVIKNGKKIMQ